MRVPKILVVDQEPALAGQVARVTEKLRPQPDVVTGEKIASLGTLLRQQGPFDVLIAGPSLANPSGLARLRVLHGEIPGMSLVLAFATRPDAKLRDIIRTGAVDVLQLPADDDSLRDIVTWALEVSRRWTPTGDSPNGTAAAVDGVGSVLTVASPTGGCGKTFLATNLAYYLHQQTGQRTCVVDLDMEFGEVATALRLRPRYSVLDLLQREDAPDDDLDEYIDEYVVAHDTGIHVLAAPKEPADAQAIDGAGLTRIFEALRCRFGFVVADTPVSLNETLLTALELADEVFVMAALDVLSVRSTKTFLDVLEKLKMTPGDAHLVFNKAERDVGIDIDQVAKLFPQGISAVIPYGREVTRSLNLGTPILAYQPTADVSVAMAAGLQSFVPERDRRQDRPSLATGGLVSRALRRARSAGATAS